MLTDPLYVFLDIIGMIAFSVSGAITGMRKKMDIYGIFLLAIVTAMGGGTIRDFLIGNVPVTVLQDPITIAVPVATALATIFARPLMNKEYQTLLIMDAIGIGMFTISGVAAGLQFGVPAHGAVLLGIITSTAGGITRDLLGGDIPLVLRRDIYASASMLGGVLYWIALVNLNWHPDLSALLCTVIIITLRVLSYKRGWHLPYPHKRSHNVRTN